MYFCFIIFIISAGISKAKIVSYPFWNTFGIGFSSIILVFVGIEGIEKRSKDNKKNGFVLNNNIKNRQMNPRMVLQT